jgi:flagellar biosynthesis protein FlhA
MHVITLDPAMEDRIRAGFEHTDRGLLVRMSPQAIEATCRLIAAGTEKLARANHAAIVLVSPQIRSALKQMTSSHLPNLIVLSYNEITRDTKIESVAMVADAKQ